MLLVYTLSFLLTSITAFVLGSFVLIKNPKSPLNRSWFWLSLTTSFYSFFYQMTISATSHSSALIYSDMLALGAIPASPTFFLFVSRLTNSFEKYKKYIVASFALAPVLLISVPIDLFFLDVKPTSIYKFYPTPGPFFAFYVAYFLFNVVISHVCMWQRMKVCDRDEGMRIKYMFMAGCIAFFAGACTFFPLYGLEALGVFTILMPFFPFIVTAAIIRHQLMDIEVIVRRTAVFAGLFAFAYGTFSLVGLAGHEFFQKYLGWSPWAATVPTVAIITFGMKPLETFLTNITERFLFQKKYDYRVLLRTFTNEVLTVLDLDKLTEQTIAGLVKIIKLESASILIFDKDAGTYSVAASFGIKDKNIQFSNSDPIVSYLKETYQPILKDESADKMDGHSQLRENFKTLSAQLTLPISHHDELIGILALGSKKSGGDFSQEDIDILMTLSRTLGIAIANARLFDTLSKTQAEAAQREKMAVIGTLAAGINHEICNPLGIVRGQCEMFLLNLRDGLYGAKSKEDMIHISSEIMNKVIKETDRATAITKKLSGFAKPSKKVEVDEVGIEKEADEVLGLIGHDLRLNNIKFEKTFPPNFPNVLADKRQIQEVLFNIIRNAAQAMDKKDGSIALSGATKGDSVIIKIADNGSGIPPDKLGQIFNPFFTTKEPGKGTGLGLFIVKQVIERNKGTIAVESQEGVGTTFVLTFPAATSAAKVMAA